MTNESAPESGLKMIEKPNLFSFATTELSQDAFIAWLLAWADTQYASADPQLHACARELITAFFTKHSKPVPRFTEVNAWPQKLSATPEYFAKVLPHVLPRTQH